MTNIIEKIEDIEVTNKMINAFYSKFDEFDDVELFDEETFEQVKKVAFEDFLNASTQIADLIAENKRLREENQRMRVYIDDRERIC